MIKFLTQEVITIIMLVSVVLFGAIVHATSQLKIARDAEKEFTRVDFLILTVIASFAGLVFGLLATLFFDNEVVVILFSAIGAFLGMAGLNKISNILLEAITSKIDK